MNISRIAAILAGLGVCAAAVALVGPGGGGTRPAGEDTRMHAQAPAGLPAAPAISLSDMTGKPWSLELLKDKRAALVVFWASW